MSKAKMTYLSYMLDEHTPTYGDRNKFVCEKKSDMSKGDVANDSSISTTVHIGTHIDMPYHFFEDGQTIENFDVDFFQFENILFVELTSDEVILNASLISALDKVNNKEQYDICIVKTGICHHRESEQFWQKNPGFHPDVATYLRVNFPKVRVLGFDSVSVSSFSERMLGREAHRAFLDPKNPILLLEDMDLRAVTGKEKIKKLTVAPLRISKCDGLPCTVIAEVM